MCGRYLIEDDSFTDDLAKIIMDSKTIPEHARGEIFPTNIAPIIASEGAAVAKWGFPHWKNASVIINARAETALEKSMFRKPLLDRRCVVLSSGFYEWDRSGAGGRKKKDKYLLRFQGQSLLCMAGMINIFRDAAGDEYGAFVILTTGASESVARIHDRMPVILSAEERDLWIGDPGFMEYALHRPGPDLTLEMI